MPDDVIELEGVPSEGQSPEDNLQEIPTPDELLNIESAPLETNIDVNVDIIKTQMEKIIMSTTATPANNFGVANTVAALKFLVDFGNALATVTDPNSPGGKNITWTEYPTFLPLIWSLTGLTSAIGHVPEEVTDLITADELAQITGVLAGLKYTQDKTEAVTDHLAVLVALKNLIFKYYVKPTVQAPNPVSNG